MSSNDLVQVAAYAFGSWAFGYACGYLVYLYRKFTDYF